MSKERVELLKTRLLKEPGAYAHVTRSRINEAAEGLIEPEQLTTTMGTLLRSGFLKKLSRDHFRIANGHQGFL